MSPLAKKKLLSQVSGAGLSSSYPYGSPPPLISRKKLIVRDDRCSGLSQAHHGQSTDHVAVSRPSVIQHVQSFRSKPSEERKGINDIWKHDKLGRSEPHRCGFSKHHLSPLADSYALKQDAQDSKEKLLERRAPPHSHMPSCLADFYSSPHLHSLYRHTERHLHNEQTCKYKGEEDKPLPPIKPRKQENNSQENENKTKVSGGKRIKHEISKSKKEKENAPKPQDASEVSRAPSQKHLCEVGPASGSSGALHP